MPCNEPIPNLAVDSPSSTGSIQFDSNPLQANVFLNNEYIGTTPLDIIDVNPGKYSYIIEDESGNQHSDKLHVHKGKITHITIDFIKNIKTEKNLDLKKYHLSQVESMPENSSQQIDKQPDQQSKSDKSTTNSNAKEEVPVRSFKDPFVKTKDKSIFYNTGHVTISTSSASPPGNVDNYPAIENVYSKNNQNPIEVMTLMNHGPGSLFYILRDKYQRFTRTEEILEPDESRILYNVYEIRLRTDVPQTEYHLVEGRVLVGGSSVPRKVFVEVRVSLQPNETFKNFGINFDNQPANINITIPAAQVVPIDYTALLTQNPLLPGQVATLLDFGTGLAMPFTIPEGYIFEAFELFVNFSTQTTMRNYFELVPGSGVFTLTNTFPFNARGDAINQNLNISFFSSEGIDPLGAPPGGRRILITVTNDDAVNSTIGDVEFLVVLRQLS